MGRNAGNKKALQQFEACTHKIKQNVRDTVRLDKQDNKLKTKAQKLQEAELQTESAQGELADSCLS